ncbi:hypothetical protein K493DRAFT_313157 [Basidiobolus meristosporus CBS 931.73]|uniref:Chitin-binding type-2 domain-containing protein n=1 Tax=Basidiobolus meristosporus CBS 931.73 TaxID=1314790 RepID=A0A1Y1YNH1_9FUNG|nr:hypothetical protein K493DRAFT_313157 [Basidiobolus meristosporus CBS 931.73]|eukprot:ORX99567.1 hypothetical protein K493DRAFT_313157 [Basidiobolus meristosporus CBS 931.73]
MRYSSVILGAAAVTAVSAVEFPFQQPGPCVEKCSSEAGKKYFHEYTQDQNSKYFVQSFSLLCDESNPNKKNFYTDSLDCLIKDNCPSNEVQLSMHQEKAICEWYAKQIAASSSEASSDKPTSSEATKSDKETSTDDSHKSSETGKSEKPTSTDDSHKSSETDKATSTESHKSSETSETGKPSETSETGKPSETSETDKPSSTKDTTKETNHSGASALGASALVAAICGVVAVIGF